MKQAYFALLAVAILATSLGCHGLNRFSKKQDGCGCSSCAAEFGCGGNCDDGSCATGGCADGQCATAAGPQNPAFVTPGGKLLGQKRMMNPPAPGPPVGAVSYPYYKTRGPRDFLAGNPPSIGK